MEILDFGCGVGQISLFLSRFGHSIKGVDISKKAISHAKETAKELNIPNVHFSTESLEQISKTKKKFDLIICIEVIEHVEKDQELLILMKRILKKNGTLFLTTPSINAPLYRIGSLKDFDRRVGHIRRYEAQDLKGKFLTAGFTKVKIHKTEGVLRNSLYTIGQLGFLIRFIKGPVIPVVNFMDGLLVHIFGESDLQVCAR